MGYTKANYYIQQDMTYTVDVRNPSAPEAEVIVRHTHTFPEARPCQRVIDREPRQPGELLYVHHTRQCYWDYLRVLVPAGSQLTDVQQQPLPAAWNLSDLDDGTATVSRGAADTVMFSTFLIVPTGERRETGFRYRLPPDVLEHTAEGWRYRLVLQKQAGREAIPVTVHVRLPADAEVVAATPALASRSQHEVVWNVDLATDQVLDITLAPRDAISGQQPHGVTP
jgi:hypothetical protein